MLFLVSLFLILFAGVVAIVCHANRDNPTW